eukprot:TRINITY_DN48498_c0_g1_i1.p1 TRINITY_DN48498_c0_g1~~TRINITY_DN48498_c0_g1_i1.p1  ORF type:complete len:423 (-),score=68.90 TRINITY_DN48498_c0_g1_i1:63-1331(-)
MAGLPIFTIAASLVANFLASENLTGLMGEVTCKRAAPAVFLDPIGASASLALLGFVLSKFAGKFSSFSEVIIHRYGGFVGGFAATLSLTGSLLWAAAQYKAIVHLLNGAGIPDSYVEPLIVTALTLWSTIGGLVADVWLDFASVVVVAPIILVVALTAFRESPHGAVWAEVQQVRGSVFSQETANMFAVGALGNLFTEELAGRVLLARSPLAARTACFVAAAIFLIIGLAPALLGVWARGALSLTDAEGNNLCDEQDDLLPLALRQLFPELPALERTMSFVLIFESMNTIDTSILMIANVVHSQVARLLPGQSAQRNSLGSVATIFSTTSVVVGVSKCGTSVWELGEMATSTLGAPLAVLCLFAASSRGGPNAGLVGGVVAQCVYFVLVAVGYKMVFVVSVVAGVVAYLVTASYESKKVAIA